MSTIHIATAGWIAPRSLDAFPAEGTLLERYAAVFDAVEINTSFYRPHRRQTYQRWAATTPAGFRFSVKAPRAITHERRLIGIEEPLERFAGEIEGLGEKLGPVLLQTPPSLAFDAEIAAAFLRVWRARIGGPTVLEPRHASWFSPEAGALLAEFEIARAGADPAPTEAGGAPAKTAGPPYRRLHGSPQVYASAYDDAALDALAGALAEQGGWCVFDNTRFGAATLNALALKARVAALA